LKIETDNSTVPPTKIYVLGARAEPEINKAEMMNLSKKVCILMSFYFGTKILKFGYYFQLYPDLAFLNDAADELNLTNESEEGDSNSD
jgi:hypothetical protein